MKLSSMWVVAIWVGIVPALLAQSGTWYSQEEAERRLARIQEIAASSEGKIEITVIRLPGEAAPACPEEVLPDRLAESIPPNPSIALANPAENALSPATKPPIPFGAEFAPLKNPDAEWQEQFNLALSLEQKNMYREALILLLRLSSQHPDNPRCGECYYEMGECLSAIKQYALARQAFCQVLRYPESTSYDDALLRVAAQLIREGQNRKAHPYLERLVADMPESEYAVLAQQLLGTI
jgi:TolA-binding protein